MHRSFGLKKLRWSCAFAVQVFKAKNTESCGNHWRMYVNIVEEEYWREILENLKEHPHLLGRSKEQEKEHAGKLYSELGQ